MGLDFSVRLPGFHIPVEGLVDADHNELRYVLKNSKTGTVYLVVSFTLLPNQETSPTENVEGAENPSQDDVD